MSKTILNVVALSFGLLGLAACADETDESDDAPRAGESAQSDAGSQSGGGTSGSTDSGMPSGGTNADAGASAGSGGANAADAGAAGQASTADDAGSAAFDLSAEERASLIFMREEEKLARDVYTQLEDSDHVFSNIAASEQMHMDAIAVLLGRYDLEDPADGQAAGEFKNETLQALYESLVEDGSASVVAAIQVGLEIEELDLRDLERASEDVTHADIERVYDQLARGSRNHLRSFYARLSALGGTYTPQYLDAAAFEVIATSSRETGP